MFRKLPRHLRFREEARAGKPWLFSFLRRLSPPQLKVYMGRVGSQVGWRDFGPQKAAECPSWGNSSLDSLRNFPRLSGLPTPSAYSSRFWISCGQNASGTPQTCRSVSKSSGSASWIRSHALVRCDLSTHAVDLPEYGR